MRRKQHILLHLVWFKAPSLPWPGYPFLGSLVLWSIQKLHDLNGVFFFFFFMRGRSYSFLTSFHSRLHSTVSLAFFTFPSFSLPMVAILWPVQNKNNYVLLLTRGENNILLLWYAFKASCHNSVLLPPWHRSPFSVSRRQCVFLRGCPIHSMPCLFRCFIWRAAQHTSPRSINDNDAAGIRINPDPVISNIR